MSFVSFWV